MAHLELRPAGTRISNSTIDVKPNQAVTVGVWGGNPALQLLPTTDSQQEALGQVLPATLCRAVDLPADQKQFTFLKEGFFRLELRMGQTNWDWARVRCASKAEATAAAKGSGTLYVDVLWAGNPPPQTLQHYVINARMVLERHGFKLRVTPGTTPTSPSQLDFRDQVVAQVGQNIEDLAKLVVKRPEYQSGNLVVVAASARQHTDPDKDTGGLMGLTVGSDYGVTGNPFVLIAANNASADGMTLLHEMCHAAGFHDHNFDQPRSIMSYGPRRNELQAERVRQLDAAFFKA
jgi:hypothetical protein